MLLDNGVGDLSRSRGVPELDDSNLVRKLESDLVRLGDDGWTGAGEEGNFGKSAVLPRNKLPTLIFPSLFFLEDMLSFFQQVVILYG